MVVYDRLKGLPQTIESVWPQGVVQTSSVCTLLCGEIVSLIICAVPGDLFRRVLPKF
jgi:hypothetical protein